MNQEMVYAKMRLDHQSYKQSADQEFIDAQYKVGYFYDHGIEVDIDKERAFYLYEAAAKEENCDAQRSLASLYELGEGIERNIVYAIYWYKKADENGCQKAKVEQHIIK